MVTDLRCAVVCRRALRAVRPAITSKSFVILHNHSLAAEVGLLWRAVTTPRWAHSNGQMMSSISIRQECESYVKSTSFANIRQSKSLVLYKIYDDLRARPLFLHAGGVVAIRRVVP